jgi:hypothetical protein
MSRITQISLLLLGIIIIVYGIVILSKAKKTNKLKRNRFSKPAGISFEKPTGLIPEMDEGMNYDQSGQKNAKINSEPTPSTENSYEAGNYDFSKFF